MAATVVGRVLRREPEQRIRCSRSRSPPPLGTQHHAKREQSGCKPVQGIDATATHSPSSTGAKRLRDSSFWGNEPGSEVPVPVLAEWQPHCVCVSGTVVLPQGDEKTPRKAARHTLPAFPLPCSVTTPETSTRSRLAGEISCRLSASSGHGVRAFVCSCGGCLWLRARFRI